MLNFIVKALKEIRELFWQYPYILINGSSSKKSKIYRFITSKRPLSYIIIFLILFTAIFYFGRNINFAFPHSNAIFIEGVILGKTTTNKLTKISPILPTAVQIEKDLTNLIYEPLFRITPNGEIINVLAENYSLLDNGKTLNIKLRNDVKWQDGDKFDADDVIETFNVLKTLDKHNSYAASTDQMDMTKIGDYEIQIKLKFTYPTIFEDLTYGILPSHILKKYNISKFTQHPINKSPIGTGPYKLESLSENEVNLTANPYYSRGDLAIKYYKIIIFDKETDAIQALKSGQIHLISNLSPFSRNEFDDYKNIRTTISAPLYRRYWGLYFNLKDTTESSASEKEVLEKYKDINLRKALNFAINRKELVEKFNDSVEESYGPIPANSWTYLNLYDDKYFTQESAKDYLNKAGYKQDEDGNWQKNAEKLKVTITYMQSDTKDLVFDQIEKDLEELGILVNLDARSLQDINQSIIPPRNFEILYYGVETSIDPDRLKLWIESEIPFPGLNISSYKTAQKVRLPITGERISKVDYLLQKAATSVDRNDRIESYESFQRLIFDEQPVIFLYHPKLIVAYNTRLKGLDLINISLPEERYNNIVNWQIEN